LAVEISDGLLKMGQGVVRRGHLQPRSGRSAFDHTRIVDRPTGLSDGRSSPEMREKQQARSDGITNVCFMESHQPRGGFRE
jgi:hypothetical protein